MAGLELTCFEIISNAGAAKSKCFESLKLAKNNEFEKAHQKIKEASENFLEAHTVHGKLISDEAGGNPLSVTLLLLHAEDQLMSAETTRDLIVEMIGMYERFGVQK